MSENRGLGYVTHVSFAKNCHARNVGWQNLECMHSACSTLATSAMWEHRERGKSIEKPIFLGYYTCDDAMDNLRPLIR